MKGFDFLDSNIKEYLEAIMEQREEILRAFIAKYGCQPDEAEQVLSYQNNKIVFYIRKKINN